jgi:hypothetical protein
MNRTGPRGIPSTQHARGNFMSAIGICMIKIQKFADFETWSDEEEKIVRKKMYDIVVCDGCGRQVIDVLEAMHQICFTKWVCFVCGDCMKVLRK